MPYMIAVSLEMSDEPEIREGDIIVLQILWMEKVRIVNH